MQLKQRGLMSIVLMVLAVVLTVLGQAGSPPEILFIDFPNEIKADGNPVSGLVGFKDPDGDVVRADFTVVAATDFQPFSVTPNVKGQKEGAFEFKIATRIAQRVTLRVTLTDEAGNKSEPKDFSFTAVAVQPPVLQVSPTRLTFSGQVGQPNPPAQTIEIRNAGAGAMDWSASADVPWLSVVPSSGQVAAGQSQKAEVRVELRGLNVGSFSGAITVTASGAQNSPQRVSVSLQVQPAAPTVLRDHLDRVYGVTFSPDGKLLASSSADRTIRLWVTTTWQTVRTLTGHSNRVTAVAFSPDGKLLASGSDTEDKTIKLWDVATGKEVRTLVGHRYFIWSVVFSPDGRLLASSSCGDVRAVSGGFVCNRGNVTLWEVSTGRIVNSLGGHKSFTTAVVFSPDGKLLASSSYDGTIRLWDVATGVTTLTIDAHDVPILWMAMSSDGKLLASGAGDGTIKLWEVPSGNEVRTLRHSDAVYSIAFSPDGKLLAAGSASGSIRLWEVSTGRMIRVLRGHTDIVWSVSFSPDGKLLASGSWDKTIRLWPMSE